MALPPRNRLYHVVIVMLAAIFLASSVAEARRGGGGFGSRGARTFQPPAATQTAPKQAAPIERSATQQPSNLNQSATRSPLAGGSGFMSARGGFLGGLLGAGLLGMLLGYGFFGGLGGLGSILGLLLQVGLVLLLVTWAVRAFQNRTRPAYAGAGAPLHRDMPSGGGYGATGGMTSSGIDLQPALEIGSQDYDAFEQALKQVQAAYSREDVEALRSLATAEVVSHLALELAQNSSRGMVNRVRDVELLQGDLAEAWREGDTEYATLAMRYSSVDYTAERDSGTIVEGDKQPFERTELWTFLRSRGGDWILSAVQEA